MLGLVELQGSTDPVQDGLGDPGPVAPFEPDVVLGAHPGQEGNLFTAQAFHAAASTEVGQARLGGGEAFPT